MALNQLDPVLRCAGISNATLFKLAALRLVTPRDVLAHLPLDLMEMLDQPLPAVEALLRVVAAATLPQPLTALDLARMQAARLTHLATQLQGLDRALRGGCACGSITELVGPAGIGKTQLCLQLAAVAASLPVSAQSSQPGSACYIDTERRFSAKRIKEIAVKRFPQQYATQPAQVALLGRIHVIAPDGVPDLLQKLQALEQGEAARNNIRVVVVDSIAALVRNDTDRQYSDQQQLLGHQAAVLKSLATRCNIPIIVSNQITTAFQTPTHVFDMTSRPQQTSYMTPALGPQWGHAVNTRLVLEASGGLRWIKVAKSPVAPTVAFAFQVDASGLQLLDRPPLSFPVLAGGLLAMPVANESL